MATFEQQALFAYTKTLKEAATLARIEALEKELAALKAKLVELQPRRPGRPRKKLEAA